MTGGEGGITQELKILPRVAPLFPSRIRIDRLIESLWIVPGLPEPLIHGGIQDIHPSGDVAYHPGMIGRLIDPVFPYD